MYSSLEHQPQIIDLWPNKIFLLRIVHYPLSHSWLECTQLPVADTPMTPSLCPVLTLVSKELSNLSTESFREPDSMANKLEDVKCGFWPSVAHVLIRKKIQKTWECIIKCPKYFYSHTCLSFYPQVSRWLVGLFCIFYVVLMHKMHVAPLFQGYSQHTRFVSSDGQMMAPKGVHILIPRASDYLTLHVKVPLLMRFG